MAAADLAKLVQTLTLKDTGLARGPAAEVSVEFGTHAFIGLVGANTLVWRVELSVKGMTSPVSQVRLAVATIGEPPAQESHAIEYTLTSKPASAAQWSVRGQTDVWTVSWSDAADARLFGITIESQDQPLSNGRLVQSTLKDASGHTIGLNRMRLVEAPTGTPSPMSVAANDVKPVFVRLEDGDGPFGTFDGVLRFAADGASATKDVSLKLQASSTGRKLKGIVLALLGLLLATYVAAILRPQMSRLQAKRAAAAVTDAIFRFEHELAVACATDIPCSGMKKRAADLVDSLSEATLDKDGLLPPPFALLPGSTLDRGVSAALKVRIDETSNALAGLLVFLRAGVAYLLERADRPSAIRLIKDLDDQSDLVTTAPDARARVDTVRKKLAGERESARPIEERSVTLQNIDYGLQTLSATAWLLWAAVALVLAATWIASDVDYGTSLDLATTFLWGFGMTTFGGSLQQLTPSSVATQISVKVPE